MISCEADENAFCENEKLFSLPACMHAIFCNLQLTFPLRNVRAATNSLCGTLFLSLSDVLIATDIGDGIETPYEFSARTTNTYDAAGFRLVIWKREKREYDSFERITARSAVCENAKTLLIFARSCRETHKLCTEVEAKQISFN